MKLLIRVIIASLILGITSWVIIQLPSVQDRLIVVAFTALGSASNNLPKEDALSAAVCGSRSPLPSPGRAETCILITAGDDLFVVDIGDGSNDNLRSWNINFRDIEAVLITHLHSDHIADLPGLHQNAWVVGERSSKLKVFGPEGIDQFTQGIEMAYAHDYVFRNEHHGDAIAPLQFAGFDTRVIDLNTPVIFDNGDFSGLRFFGMLDSNMWQLEEDKFTFATISSSGSGFSLVASTGDITYTNTTTIPEPTAVFSLLALGAIGSIRILKKGR